MISKIITLAALVAVAQGSIYPYTYYPAVRTAPVIVKYATPTYTDHKYEFGYAVNDPYTGDQKSQHEVRDGTGVRGYYKVADADGTFRTVRYTADAHSGFNAEVEKTGYAVHATPAVVRTIPYSAPIAAAPYKLLPYTAPITSSGYYP